MKKHINAIIREVEDALASECRDQELRELSYALGELQSAADCSVVTRQRKRAGLDVERRRWHEKTKVHIGEAQRYGEQ